MNTKVILQKDITNLGEAGDVKEVAKGYVRNFLLPNNLVILFNESSKAAIDHQKHLIKVKKDKRKKESEKIADKVRTMQITIKQKAGEENKLFGSVTSLDISRSLEKEGLVVDRRKIVLDEPIKELGTFKVHLKLDEGVTADLTVVVEGE